MSDQVRIQAFLKQHDDGVRVNGLPVALLQAIAAIPWGEGRTIEEVLETKKVGTCTGKHLVLQACLDALHIPYRPVVCTFRWQDQGLSLPQHLLQILETNTWEHGHNFVQIQNESGDWMDIDCTWDSALSPYGFRSFPTDWDGRTSFVGVTHIVDRWDNVSIAEKKSALIARLSPEQREARNTFLAGFITWIASLR